MELKIDLVNCSITVTLLEGHFSHLRIGAFVRHRQAYSVIQENFASL